MSLNALIGAMPHHQYVWVDSTFTHKEPKGFVPAVWFGLVSVPSRAWGCNLLLETGAIYRNVPPHALAFSEHPTCKDWTLQDAQTWDCYGYEFSCLCYPFLSERAVKVRANQKEYDGDYLFTVAPVGDGFSLYPEQAKEFSFIQLENGRLTIQPTNHVLVIDRSFTKNAAMEFPKDLRRQTEVWASE